MALGKAVRLIPSPCPTCGVTLDAATHTDEDKNPQPGDLAFCTSCGSWQQFGPDLRRIPASQEQLDYAANDKRCQEIKAAWFLAMLELGRL